MGPWRQTGGSTQAELQRQNGRLELLLNLSNKITSNLDLRDVICGISGNSAT
jgi:formate hydrogenlyase transcriptional activator